MKYMGSKNRVSKHILPIILKNKKDNQYYIEPFVGGANTLDKVTGLRIGVDINEYLIAMWQAVVEGWMPRDDYTEDEYYYIKKNKDENKHLAGYFGFALSYGGKFFGGWRRDSKGERNYVKEAYNNAKKQFPKLRDVHFECRSYDNIHLPKKSIVYCDPPYNNTTKYNNNFNHDIFWEWVRSKVKESHKVFVSEYHAPDDFVSIWEKQISSSLTKNTGSKSGVEKLFIHKSQKDI